MRALTFLLIFAASAQGAEEAWTSRQDVLSATQVLRQKIDGLQTALSKVTVDAEVLQQWRTVGQQTDAMVALLTTGASFDDVMLHYKKLGSALMDARRLMYQELLCYNSVLSKPYQAVRLAYRRLDRNMSGLPTAE
jgi:hypothetical protein